MLRVQSNFELAAMSVLSLSQYLPAKLWKAQTTAAVNVPKARPEPIEAQLIIEEPAPKRCSKRRKVIQEDSQRSPGLLDLPQELVLDVAELLSSADLAFFDLTCRALRLGAVSKRKPVGSLAGSARGLHLRTCDLGFHAHLSSGSQSTSGRACIEQVHLLAVDQ